ncbi:MAG: ssl1498 family light-harvesting-like protein [Cyanobacteria bacterium]|nr:ssl1498 family light-harvesting-like protein [Cyanobacteriota bacterium]MDW8202695.1 ssl1498 family light-harvesting-like protein [Cyanobacteriota bacterium SKYGB_h_bin112]
MPYTTEDGGRLNNFASEPKMYVAEPTTRSQVVNYIVVAVSGSLLVVGLIVLTFVITKAS